MSRENYLKKIMTLDFVALDLGLYLNTHPEDMETLHRYNCIIQQSDQLKAAFEAEFGPLDSFRSKNIPDWRWKDNPWPWEASDNFSI